MQSKLIISPAELFRHEKYTGEIFFFIGCRFPFHIPLKRVRADRRCYPPPRRNNTDNHSSQSREADEKRALFSVEVCPP